MGEVKDSVKGQGLKDKDLPSPPPSVPASDVSADEKSERASFGKRFARSLRVMFARPGLADRLVKTKPVSAGPITGDNLVDIMGSLCEEVSTLIETKDDDTYNEGNAAKAENIRKAGMLRSVHSLLTSAKNILEDY